MKPGAMADACRQQLQTAEAAALGFEERFGLLVDAEWTAREQRKMQRRLRGAKPPIPPPSRPSTSPTRVGSTASRS